MTDQQEIIEKSNDVAIFETSPIPSELGWNEIIEKEINQLKHENKSKTESIKNLQGLLDMMNNEIKLIKQENKS